MKTQCSLTQEQIAQTVAFHGHHCPGLSIGLRAAQWCLLNLGRAGDEDILVVTETDMCGDDAIQFLTGCTFGKGNFIFRDTGKVAFTFFRRKDDKRARLVLNPAFAADFRARLEQLSPEQKQERDDLRQEYIARIMNASLDELFLISIPDVKIPQRARLHKSIPCDLCGEGVMEPRLIDLDGKKFCKDCAERLANKQ